MKLVALCLDQAATSGWAITLVDDEKHLGLLLEHGIAKKARERAEVLNKFLAYGIANYCPAHVVFEDHSKIPASKARTTATILGMGDARGRWREQLDLLGHVQAHRHMVTPDQWRGAVLGPRYAHAKTDVCKRAAVQHAIAVTGAKAITHDAAEAVCLALFTSVELPKMLRKGAA